MENKDNIIDLQKLNRAQLIDLIIRQSLLTRNEISIENIRISSSEPLNVIEQTINRLVKNNQDFLVKKKIQKRENLLIEPFLSKVEDE